MNFLATGVRPEKRAALKVAGTDRSRNEVEKPQNRTVAKEDIIEEKPEEHLPAEVEPAAIDEP